MVYSINDIIRGLKLAQASSDKQLKKECAMILDNLKVSSSENCLKFTSLCGQLNLLWLYSICKPS